MAQGLQNLRLHAQTVADNVEANTGYIGAAVSVGLITGYEAHTFRGNDPVTREHMGVMIARADAFAGQYGKLAADKDQVLGSSREETTCAQAAVLESNGEALVMP